MRTPNLMTRHLRARKRIWIDAVSTFQLRQKNQLVERHWQWSVHKPTMGYLWFDIAVGSPFGRVDAVHAANQLVGREKTWEVFQSCIVGR